ncbi:HAD family phosphatase [Mameliella alba]|nr:HAD family phosphatase [Antarctobacter heliothermus]MBY6143949.1 HAD family phosphatase [Mameliella alba]MCA0953999.1 HAD family phosphatase [Mameliella alba]
MTRPALLFDLDGTMLMTDDIHREVFVDLMRPYGIEVTESFYMAHVHGRLNTDFFAEFLPDLEDPQGLSDLKEAQFRDRLPRPYPAMPGAEALIERARTEGWALAVVTNANRLNAEAMLGAVGLRDAFELLIIGEECARGKPDPEPYLAAMRALDVAPEQAVAFEDSASGLRAAAGSGAYTVGVRSGLSDTDLRAHGARDTIADFNDPALETILARLTGEPVQ